VAKRKEVWAHQDQVEHLDGRVLCLAPGVPRITVPQVVVGYQILQKPGALTEEERLVRDLAVLEGHGTWVNFALRSMMAVSSPETIMALSGRGPAKGKPWVWYAPLLGTTAASAKIKSSSRSLNSG
jgi:hypothetical protein